MRFHLSPNDRNTSESISRLDSRAAVAPIVFAFALIALFCLSFTEPALAGGVSNATPAECTLPMAGGFGMEHCVRIANQPPATTFPTPLFSDHIQKPGGPAFAAALTGFVFGLGLIFSLGPQNHALIRAGITRSHPVAVASTGFVSEILLVGLGICGLAAVLARYPIISGVLQVLAVAFLVWCGLRTLTRLRADPAIGTEVREPRLRAVSSMLFVTWLNPLVWLEAMFLVGILASDYASGAQFELAAGFLAASAVKFYGWSFVGISLSGIMRRPSFCRQLDAVSGVALLFAAGVLTAHLAGGV